MEQQELKDFLNAKAVAYEQFSFIASDPILIPHLFTKKEDIEISAFLTATISWGNRKSILKNANKLMDLLDHDPYQFVMQHTTSDLKSLDSFVHRTFNAEDVGFFMKSLRNIYKNHNGLEGVFTSKNKESFQEAISNAKQIFFEIEHPIRSTKHFSDPLKGSAAKRINMFLRWMVRSNACGVDFGLWEKCSPAALSCPLDVHSGNVARKTRAFKKKTK